MSDQYVRWPSPKAGVISLNGLSGVVVLAAGSGITLTPVGNTITIAATGGGGGSGTVTSVSVVSANGLAGTVATATTTPAITLSTTITGILQGNGTAISAATTGNLTDAGTDGITVTGGSGAVLGSGTSISQHVADSTHNGYLSSADWTTFNNKQAALTLGNLTDVGTDGIVVTGGTGAVVGSGTSIAQHVADATHNGYLSSTDWSTFNNKLDKTFGNYITNPDFEVNTTGWNLYNNSGNAAAATVVAQDITYTAVASGNAGNGINIDYIFHPTQSYLTPLVTVVSPTHITVAWYNGPTLANNPTATQLKAAFDAVPGAVALATSAITGTASKLQYETGSNITANGGDTAPIGGTGGVPSGVTFTRNTSTPLIGVASGDLSKDANSEQGQGVSTDFVINSIDKNSKLQISFIYQGSSGMVLGSSSDVQIFIYDITNAALISVSPKKTLAGPTGSPHTFVATFQSTSSSSYRLILHIATTNATAWDLLLDSVVVDDQINAVTATQVPSLVLLTQPISGAVTDHMCVMWRDSATQWVPATIAGAAIPAFGDDVTQLGFATNISGSFADIYIRGAMSGFSFGPFVGYQQYIDNTAGAISPLPSPFNDTYVTVGMAIASDTLNIQFNPHVDLISNGSGTPLKGGLLSNSAVNDGTGDQVLTVGANGNVLVANSAASLGINWAPAVVAAAPFTYTLATRTLTIATATNAVAGILSAADHTTFAAAAPLASPAFTGTPSMPTGTTGVTQTAGDSSTKLATTAFVTTADNLKAPLASPTFTGDVNVSTGNLLISTIGKGPQIKTGTNAKIGTAVLVGGTVTVANTSVTANSRIFVTSNTDGGTPGWLRVSAKTVGTSFVITSSSGTDTSTVAWVMIESIP